MCIFLGQDVYESVDIVEQCPIGSSHTTGGGKSYSGAVGYNQDDD